jgi:cell division protein ZapB
MNTKNKSNIEALESKVEELLALSRKLSTENIDLKQQLQEIRGDRAHLFEQKEQVRTQVESMITRLKMIETA